MRDIECIPLYARILLFGVLCLYEGMVLEIIRSDDLWLNILDWLMVTITLFALYRYFFKDVLKKEKLDRDV